MKREAVDVLVIGAGPAGSVAAAILHRKGYRVKVVEKLKFPRFVIGESLLPRCMEALEEAGLLEAVKEAGFQEKFGAKFVKDGRICDFNFSESFTPGWTWTWQVPRATFDQVLTDALARMGVPVHFETGVTGIAFNGTDSVTTVEPAGEPAYEIAAKFIIDGSGYGRVIPKLFGLDRPSTQPPRKTVFAHILDPNRTSFHEPNRITIVLHRRDVWIWIIPFSNGITSVGFVGGPEFFESLPEDMDAQMRALIASEPALKDRFRDAGFVFEPKTLSSWSVTTDTFYGPGYVLTGNVTEFLDPIFSSGVTLATVSSQQAARLVSQFLEGQQIDWKRDYTDFMMQGINTFRSYVNGWYDGHLQDIFFAIKPNPAIQRQICSVLAGYVWDVTNPYVKNHDRALSTLAHVLRLEEAGMGNK